jgi:hypothetical protein
MDDFRLQLTNPALLEVYDYWSSLRRGRHMPARKDFDPLTIPQRLPNLMLIDVFHDPLRLRYRLIGTRVVAASAEDRTGKYFDDVSFFRIHPEVLDHYRTMIERAVPLYSLEPFLNRMNNMSYQAERLMLPLSGDDKTVDMVMVYFHFASGPYAQR